MNKSRSSFNSPALPRFFSLPNPAFHGMKNPIMSSRIMAGFVLALAATAQMQLTAAEPAKPDASSVSTTASAPVTASLEARFGDEATEEVPDFQKHVTPLLGRLGCNGRACHGSFQGRGGFQLSLFGYDFKTDHEALLAEHTGRVDLDDLDESLILAKPLDADIHEGGKRFDRRSWQHNVLRRWIEAGAEFDPESVQALVKLQIEPAEINVQRGGDQIPLTVIAHWEDGTSEDVTPLCRFSSNDRSIAEVTDAGVVAIGDPGDTHVVVSYDNAVVAVPVLQPFSMDAGSIEGSIATSEPTHPIDVLVQEKLTKLGVVASGRCSDEEYIRRASLDITGVLPPADRVREFLNDTSPNKRAALMEELLATPAYSAWWATRLSDWTGNNAEQLNNVLPVRNVSTKLWYEWLRARLEQNVPYDELVEGIVNAQTLQEDESYEDYCKEMTRICNGDLQDYADRDGMTLYWSRRNFQKPEERAIGFAYTFLGVRIECAQCHKHPFDQWSKQDFDDFASLFSIVRSGNANQVSPENKAAQRALLEEITGGSKKLNGGELRRAILKAAQKGGVVPFGELWVQSRGLTPQQKRKRQQAAKNGRKLAPVRIPTGKILGAESAVALSDDPRPALMEWLRDPENPYFAKAIVNRVWSNYFGIGIVDPTDDMNLANPPGNAALLDYLASEFIANDFDLKWLHREIVSSETYQRSAEGNTTNLQDRKNFARHMPRRLPAEVVYDMVALATGSTKRATQMREELAQMAIADGKARARNRNDFALEVFGQSIRETNCDCDRSDDPSLLQSIYLRNDSEMYQRIADRNGWVAEACNQLGVAPPSRGMDQRQAAQLRAAEGTRRQLVARAKQFLKLPEQRREKQMASAKKAFAKGKQRIGKGFEVPKFEDLLADPDAWTKLEPRQSEDAKGSAKATLTDVVEEAYLRTLTRYPDATEIAIATDYVNQSPTPTQGIEGLMWALVNTKEFIISH